MAMIHHEPRPNFDSPATQVFALENRLSSCMAENAALHEEAMRLRLTGAERDAVKFFGEAGVYWSTGEGVAHARVLLGLLKRVAI